MSLARTVCLNLYRPLSLLMQRVKLDAAIETSAGAWQDEDHPELRTGDDIDRWIAEGRAALSWDRPVGDDKRLCKEANRELRH